MKKRYKKAEKTKRKLITLSKITGLILITIGLGWLAGEAKRFLETDAIFQIETISFEENDLFKYLEAQKILEPNYNPNFFGFNLAGLEKKLGKIPQIENVVVKRSFPNIIRVKIKEREPVLLLYWEGSFYAVGPEGRIFPQLKKRFFCDIAVITGIDEGEIDFFWDKKEILPQITLALKINNYIKEENLGVFWEISEIHFGGTDEIFVYTFNPRLQLRLSEDNLAQKFENLGLVLGNLRDKIDSVDYIDLRLKEKVFVHFN